MFYIVATIGLVFLSTFVLLPKFNEFTERYSLSINYFLTLIATLVGVLLAISITNHEADKKEKQDVIKLLNSSVTAVDACYDYTEELIEYYNEIPDDNELKSEFYAKNQLPYPDYLDAFLMQNIVSKNLSGEGLSDLNVQVINLKRTHNYKANLYLSVLNRTRNILLVELSFQRGEITEQQLDEKLSLL